MQKYNPKKIEKKWQSAWAKQKAFVASDGSKQSKKYVLIEFPYPSGEGLHMGHLRPYVAGDVYSRYWRLKGHEVLYPIGWDAFGLPAENFAIKNKVHPKVSTAKNIKNAKEQINSWGISFDWSREVNTTDPEYYKWTQWIFLQFFKAGLAYEATGLINWCPKDKTGLANEEVIDGKCERCGTVVEKKNLRQWYLKITAYAEKLLEGLKQLPEWPEPVKIQQENWIGKSTGANVKFQISNDKFEIEVFTTRVDTIFGATYLVIAPEHEAISKLKNQISNIAAVEKYVEESSKKTEQVRQDATKEKTGVVLEGVKAINPATKEEIPVWVADYVLGGYGTGAIMAVPAHDERDMEFAKKFGLPVKQVVAVTGEADAVKVMEDQSYAGEGLLVNSGEFTGQKSAEVRAVMAKKYGKLSTSYKLRDWVFSRQRYWGEPIPVIHCETCGVVAVPDKDLPVRLPEVKNYEPTGTGESPLAAIEDWVNTKCPKCEGLAKRETNTMPQWAGSSWYFLRYTDPQNTKAFAGQGKLKAWLPVDVYFGGMEHTTLHLLYSRFWHLFLADQGLVPVKEPYTKRVPHGIILGPDGEKMSKSKGNVVNPDDIVEQYGADALRMFELFLGPHEAQVAWSDKGVVGVKRFLERVWAIGIGLSASPAAEAVEDKKGVALSEVQAEEEHMVKVEKALHKLIRKVGEDIESFRFNTSVAAFMEFVNTVKDAPLSLDQFKKFLVVLSPFAPHIAEELCEQTGLPFMQEHKWPEYDEKYLAEDVVTVVVQVNGKVREKIQVPAEVTEAEVKSLALSSEKIKSAMGTNAPKQVIYVPGKVLNIVV